MKKNGFSPKPSSNVRIGEEIVVAVAEGRRTIVVAKLSATRGPASIAQSLYQESSSSIEARQLARLQKQAHRLQNSFKGRPTKRNRRVITQFTNTAD